MQRNLRNYTIGTQIYTGYHKELLKLVLAALRNWENVLLCETTYYCHLVIMNQTIGSHCTLAVKILYKNGDILSATQQVFHVIILSSNRNNEKVHELNESLKILEKFKSLMRGIHNHL